MIVSTEKPGGKLGEFTRIYAADLRRTDLTPASKLVLSFVRRCSYHGPMAVNGDRLASELGLTVEEVADSLIQLSESGLIHVDS